MQHIQGAIRGNTSTEVQGYPIIHDGVGKTISRQVMPKINFSVGARIAETIIPRVSGVLNTQVIDISLFDDHRSTWAITITQFTTNGRTIPFIRTVVMTPGAVQGGKTFIRLSISGQITLIPIVPTPVRILIGTNRRFHGSLLETKEIDVQGSILRGSGGTHSQVAGAKIASRPSGGIELTECITTIHPYFHHMGTIVFLILFDGDPELVPNRRIKRNHIGTVTLPKIDVS